MQVDHCYYSKHRILFHFILFLIAIASNFAKCRLQPTACYKQIGFTREIFQIVCKEIGPLKRLEVVVFVILRLHYDFTST